MPRRSLALAAALTAALAVLRAAFVDTYGGRPCYAAGWPGRR